MKFDQLLQKAPGQMPVFRANLHQDSEFHAGFRFYSFEQFRHGKHVPGIPLEPVTPGYVYGHAIWTYLAAVVYVVAGIPLLIGKKTRAAATWVGLTVLFVDLVVYVPMAVVQRASLDGINYVAETLMFCGVVLLLAGAMPRDEQIPTHLDTP